MALNPDYFGQAGRAQQNSEAEAVAANRRAKQARSGQPRRGPVLCKFGLHRWDEMKTDAGQRYRHCRRCGKDAMRADN